MNVSGATRVQPAPLRRVGWLLGLLVAACSVLPGPTSGPTGAPGSTASPAPESGPPAGGATRLGDHDLLGSGGAVVGRFTATRVSDEQTTLVVQLERADTFHPWGIYDQAVCGRPRANHDAPYQFADIEGGARTEDVETAGYLGFPGNLVVLVFGPDGGPVAGCADLGLGGVAAGPTPSAELCEDGSGTGAGSGATQGTPTGSGQPGRTTRIAFTREVLANGDIYTMEADGSDVRRLTTALGPDIKPSWSPDGSRIAFRSPRDGDDDIVVMRADGSCQVAITANNDDDRSPAWSPDGCWIAFDHFFAANLQDIALVRPSGGALVRVTTRSGEYPAWSPDGTRIAFASARDGDYDLYVIGVDGSNERHLTDDPGYEFYPAWSPDGQWLAYESEAGATSLEIHVMRADGTDDRRLTTNDVEDRFPAWSADGRLAWSSDGTIMVAASVEAEPVAVGNGQFAAWDQWTSTEGNAACS